MRWLGPMGIFVTGCYGASAQPGAPCTPLAPNCPAGQSCAASLGGFTCELDGTSNSPDAHVYLDGPLPPPNEDLDGDGVKNAQDNCPNVVNADQHNEDNDPYGDACDPCPMLTNIVETDIDGDGVGDMCDPHPFTPGDRIYLFESFKNGVPAAGNGWDPFGPWQYSQDGITMAATATHANLGYTLPNGSARETVWTTMTITATGVAANNRNAGVIDQKDNSSNGVACDLNLDAASTYELALMHATTAADGGTELQATAFSWTNGSKYTLKLTRDGNAFTCATGNTTTNVTSGITASPAEAGFYISNASARFEYLFVVTSP